MSVAIGAALGARYEQGRRDERAAIVAWLRGQTKGPADPWQIAATAIERGAAQ